MVTEGCACKGKHKWQQVQSQNHAQKQRLWDPETNQLTGLGADPVLHLDNCGFAAQQSGKNPGAATFAPIAEPTA